jgi:hypothetical protein
MSANPPFTSDPMIGSDEREAATNEAPPPAVRSDDESHDDEALDMSESDVVGSSNTTTFGEVSEDAGLLSNPFAAAASCGEAAADGGADDAMHFDEVAPASSASASASPFSTAHQAAPEGVVRQPHANDVLMGRGGACVLCRPASGTSLVCVQPFLSSCPAVLYTRRGALVALALLCSHDNDKRQAMSTSTTSTT